MSSSSQQQQQQQQQSQEWSLPVGAYEPVMDIIAQRIMELEMRALSAQGNTVSDFQVAKLIDLVVRFPASCQRTYRVGLTNGRTGQQYPLSSILKLQPPLHLVQHVVQAYPAALHATAADGFRPLDTACWKNASVQVVEYLHQCNTQAVSAQCKGVMHPLHIALCHFRSSTNSESVVNFLLQACPEASKQRDANGKYPLHHAASSGASIAVLEQLLAACPESITAADPHGYTPLHSACRTRNENSNQIVAFLKAAASETVTMPNVNGNTPLDLAAMYQTPQVIATLNSTTGACQRQLLHLAARTNQADAVEALAEAFVESATDVVPLQLACQRTDDPVEVVRVLLRYNAAALLTQNEQGQLPLELLAKKSNRRTVRLVKQTMAEVR